MQRYGRNSLADLPILVGNPVHQSALVEEERSVSRVLVRIGWVVECHCHGVSCMGPPRSMAATPFALVIEKLVADSPTPKSAVAGQDIGNCAMVPSKKGTFLAPPASKTSQQDYPAFHFYGYIRVMEISDSQKPSWARQRPGVSKAWGIGVRRDDLHPYVIAMTGLRQ